MIEDQILDRQVEGGRFVLFGFEAVDVALDDREDRPDEQHPDRIDAEQHGNARRGESPVVQPGIQAHGNRFADVESQRVAVVGDVRFVVADIVRQHDVGDAEHKRSRLQQDDQQIGDVPSQRKVRPLQQQRRQRSGRHIHEDGDEKDAEAHRQPRGHFAQRHPRNRKRAERIEDPDREAERPDREQQQIRPRRQDQTEQGRKSDHRDDDGRGFFDGDARFAEDIFLVAVDQVLRLHKVHRVVDGRRRHIKDDHGDEEQDRVQRIDAAETVKRKQGPQHKGKQAGQLGFDFHEFQKYRYSHAAHSSSFSQT